MNTATLLTMLLSSLLMGTAVFLGSLWLTPLWDVVTARQFADLSPRLRELSMDQSQLPRYLRLWGLAMLGVLVLTTVLRLYLLVPAAVYLLYILPRYLLEARIRQRRTLLRDQMVGAGVALANATRAGLSLAQGLESIAKEMPEPLATELRRIVGEYQRGRPLPEAIRDAQQRLRLDGFTLFASAILTCLERGGKVTEALERISKSLQENQRLERKLDADTASGRKVVFLLGVFPLVFLGGFYALDPQGTGLLFSTLIGQGALLAVGVLVYFSVRWAQRILSIQI
jgi:tight adherence protein B